MLFWVLSIATTTYLSCIEDNILAMSGSLKTDVALTLSDLVKTVIRSQNTFHLVCIVLHSIHHDYNFITRGLLGEEFKKKC